MEDLLTFEDAYNDAKEQGGKISVLLGNGFSMAYDARRFSFTNLLETAKSKGIIKPDGKLSKMFDILKTADFEKVIRILENGKIVTQIYVAPYAISNIQLDIKDLKKHLVNTITNNHPEKAVDIPEKRSKACANFLMKFDKLYSLNYDLLAYWVIMQNDLDFTDGFAGNDDTDYVVYTDSKEHSLLFLHGALHLFDYKTDTVKLCYNRTGETLKKQIYTRLLQDVYPVFISEGTSDEKLDKIRHNYYLSHCYKSLKNQGGNLFVFGTMLKSNDDHIREAIIKGKFKRLYIGVWSEQELSHAQLLKNEFEEMGTDRNPKKAILYNAKTVKPWG